jgi:AraC-like DNA-binding protein
MTTSKIRKIAKLGPLLSMSREIPKNYLLRRTFADVDDLAAEAEAWNVDFRQLDRGAFVGRLLQFGGDGVHISHARFSRSLRQKGMPPTEMRTIAVPASPKLRLQWRGKLIDGRSLMVFPDGSELSSVSGPDFHVYTCSFPKELLSSVGEILKVGDIDEASDGVDAVRVDSSAIEELRSCLLRICSHVRQDPTALSHEVFRRQLSCELPRRLLTAIAQSQGKCPPATRGKRLAALERAEAFIEQHAGDRIKVSDICRAAGVSERTLEYAFVERFGIGPKEYLNAFRLVSVRRQLRVADPRRFKVADVANAWGFWHMGQFAADYKQRFDELPSETLHREYSSFGNRGVRRSH